MRLDRSRRTRLKASLAVTAALAVTAGLTVTVASSATAAPDREAKAIAEARERVQGLERTTPPLKPRALVPAKGRYSFLLELDVRSTQRAYTANLNRGKQAAKSSARNQLSNVRAAQREVAAALPAGTKELYRAHAVISGIAVTTNVRNEAALARIKGVKRVLPLTPKERTNGYAVPFMGGAAAWEAYGNTGEETTIAILDTGLDYTHANFGGPGTTEAFDTAEATSDQPADPALFPNDKIIGGFDLTGDDYNASGDTDEETIPQPDPNPLDCDGHGSHVGGSAAGFGVNADGSTYTGSYDESTPIDAMKIGPGVAPDAKLYGYRVFGCAGSSAVVGSAIDLALDPNGDGDISDAVDVINMSLGADFGSYEDADSVMADNAAAAGVNVVVASGNGGDVYDVGGSPGNAPRTIAVANSVDAESLVDALLVGAPAAIAGPHGATRSVEYDWEAGPDLVGDVVRLTDPTNLDGCDPLNVDDTAAVAGKIAFLEWTNDDATRRCGSIARATVLEATEATGFIFGGDTETWTAGISGSAVIPGVLTSKSAADGIRAALLADETVTITGTEANGFLQEVESLNDTLNSSSSRNSRTPGAVKPDVTAVGTSIFSTAVGTGDDGFAISGTSMATPMVAGLAALMTAEHPDWTTEEIKAGIMNTAVHDLYTGEDQTGDIYAPNRVGSGRVDIPAALENDVLAYVGDDAGAVSASFGPLEIPVDGGPMTLTKTIKVVNKGLQPASYDVSYEAITEIPGAEYSVSPASVSLDAKSQTTVTLTLDIDPTLLTKTVDPTVDVDALIPGLRSYLADASGRVLLTNDDAELRVPVYAGPRPASTTSHADTLSLSAGAVQTGELELTGSGLAQGAGDETIESLTAGFALHAESDEAVACDDEVTAFCVFNEEEKAADLKYVGTTTATYGPDAIEDGFVYFAINTHGPWNTPAWQQFFEIYIDVDADGDADFVTFNSRLAPDSDIMTSETYDLESGANVDLQLLNDLPGFIDSAIFDSDTMVLPVNIAALGVTEGSSSIDYGIYTYSNQKDAPVDTVGFDGDGELLDGSLSMDLLEPGVFLGDGGDVFQFGLTGGDSLLVNRNRDAYKAENALGAMIVHFHNEVGNKAQIVDLVAEGAESQVGLALDPTSVAAGGKVIATVTVADTENEIPTGEVTITTGDTVLGTGQVDDTGSAVVVLRPAPAGDYDVVAEYAGNDTYAPGTSDAVALEVVKNKASIKKFKLPNQAARGSNIKAVVKVANANGLTPTGKVKIKLGKKVLGAKDLGKKGKAKITFKIGTKGTKKIKAVYVGDGSFTKAKAVDTIRIR